MTVSVSGASLHYGSGAPALHALDLALAPGEQLALIGPSGAGKSSLLHLLATAQRPAGGRVTVLGQDVAALRGASLRALRARIGLVQQVAPLPPRQRVVTAVLAGRLGQWSLLRALRSLLLPVDIDGARAALARLDVADKLFARCQQLSGGQWQRVGLARVLYQQPDLLLVDEPVSAMDPVLADHTLRVLCDDARARGATLVTSLHTVELALAHFPRLVGLRDGRILFDKPREAVTPADLAALYANTALAVSPAPPDVTPVTRYIPRC